MFRASTILPSNGNPVEGTLERLRLLDFLDREPATGTISWMIGPIGSGKTTIALQWASRLNQPVQYVSVKPPPLPSERTIQPPSEFGHVLATLLNAYSDSIKEPSAEEIRYLLNRVVAFSQSESEIFVIDDLEFIRRSAMDILRELLIEALPKIKVVRALLTSRTIDSNMLGSLQILHALRLVLPPTLAFDQQEACEAHRIGVFGTATPEQVNNARIRSGGWITGMLTELGERDVQTISESAFRNDVMNDLLLYQPPPILHAIIASAHLPFNNLEIWERWFDHLELPQWLIPSTITQIPTLTDSDPEGNFAIAPVMASALRELRSISVSDESINDLLSIAIDWYVENDEIASAVSLATENDVRDPLLRALKNLCVRHAETEDWSVIIDILKSVPVSEFMQEPDLVFWYLHGLVENDKWGEMKQLYDRVARDWSRSADPLILGRLALVQSWSDHMLNKGEDAFKQAEAAYSVLPSTANRERMWSAGTVSLIQSLRGFQQDARRWSALANFEQTFLPNQSRWWHNNAGPLRYSWLAIAGMIDETYEIASMEVRNLGGDSDPNSARYLLLLAQISIERLELDNAADLLERARLLVSEKYSLAHHFRIAQANWYRAKGDFESALNLLSTARKPAGQRFDQFAREIFTLARLELDAGNVDAAELYISAASSGDRAWPKNFGDAHPGLVRARLRLLAERHDDAIAMAHAVAAEAKLRKHAQFEIMAYATLAYIYASLDRTKPRERAAEAALEAGGKSRFELAFIVNGQDVRELAKPQLPDGAFDHSTTSSFDRRSTLERLTARELEVLSFVAKGLSNKQIADQMYISISTVKNHLASAYDKLGTNNRRGAIRIAQDLELIDS